MGASLKKAVIDIGRPIAWALVILGVLFTGLKAYLVGIPAGLLGGLALFAIRRLSDRQSVPVIRDKKEPVNGEDLHNLGEPFHPWNNATNPRYVDDPSNPANPAFDPKV